MSVISGTIAALSQRKSDKQQNQITQQQNLDNMLLQLAGRGAPLTGSNVPASAQGSEAAILPYYFGDLEKSLASDARSQYEASSAYRGDPSLRLADYDSLVSGYNKSIEANDLLAEDLATGRMTDKQIAEAAPSFAARTKVAEASRDAGLEALQETLNEIDSIQAGKGYSGDSTGKRMLRFNARRSIGSQSAKDLAGANLENAMEERSIRESGRASQLANLNLPDQRISSAITRKQAPLKAVSGEFNESLAPFGFFNIGPNQFTPGEKLSAPPNTLGDIATQMGQTNAQVGSALANYYSNKNLQSKSYSGARNSGGGYGAAPAGTTYTSDYSYSPDNFSWGSEY